MAPKTRKGKPKVVTFVVDNLRADLGLLTATATVKWKLNNGHIRHESDSAAPIQI
jgi:hypothetical protein